MSLTKQWLMENSREYYPDEIKRMQEEALYWAAEEEMFRTDTANLLLCSPTEFENCFIVNGEVIESNKFKNL